MHKKVWDTFNMQNLGEYHDFYVQSDTLQLADVFEKFEKNALKYINSIQHILYLHLD